MAKKLMILIKEEGNEYRHVLTACPVHQFKKTCRKTGRRCEYPESVPSDGCFLVGKNSKIEVVDV